MNITNYKTLLAAAKQQPTPQRFLFVFLKKSLSDDHNDEQAFRFESGMGGELQPVMSVDKSLNELGDFDELKSESKLMKKHWDIVLVACLAGNNGVMPTSEESVKPLETMMKTVEMGGDLSKYMAFDRKGNPLVFS
jgi:hypothetical protein